MRALYQFITIEVTRLIVRYTAMRDHHDLDRLAGLVQHRTREDLHQIGVP